MPSETITYSDKYITRCRPSLEDIILDVEPSRYDPAIQSRDSLDRYANATYTCMCFYYLFLQPHRIASSPPIKTTPFSNLLVVFCTAVFLLFRRITDFCQQKVKSYVLYFDQKIYFWQIK